MNCSVGAFLLLAFCTKSRILETVESPNSFVTSTVNSPFLLIVPDRISFPGSTSHGTDSPVMADVSSIDIPSITLPSRGTFFVMYFLSRLRHSNTPAFPSSLYIYFTIFPCQNGKKQPKTCVLDCFSLLCFHTASAGYIGISLSNHLSCDSKSSYCISI